jgi:hypothetical protein
MKKLILALTIITLGCSNKEKKNGALEFEEASDSTGNHKAIRQNQIDSFAQRSPKAYESSVIFRDGNSDSLLVEIDYVRQSIETFMKKGREVKKKKYGAGDYYGAYKIYVFNSDTLVINKGDAGEYGFDNDQFLIRKDSLVFAREYHLEAILSRQGVDSITEEITSFKNKSMVFVRRTRNIKNLSNLYLGNVKFDTIKDNPTKRYQALREKLKHIYELELY